MTDIAESLKEVKVDEGLAKALLECVLLNNNSLAIGSQTYPNGHRKVELFEFRRQELPKFVAIDLDTRKVSGINYLMQSVGEHSMYNLRPLYEFLRQHREEYGIKKEMPELNDKKD